MVAALAMRWAPLGRCWPPLAYPSRVEDRPRPRRQSPAAGFDSVWGAQASRFECLFLPEAV
jgi:hypothetical protein